MKMEDLNDKTVAELKDESKKLRREYFDMRFQHGTRRLIDTASLKRARRDIARIETALKQQLRKVEA